MSLRSATSADFGRLWAIVEPQISEQLHWPKDLFLSELNAAQTWVWEEAGSILAFVCLRDLSFAIEISVLATAVDSKRSGKMYKLLKALIDGPCHGRELWLDVHEKNLAARNLYEKLGFLEVGRRRNYYKDGSSAHLLALRPVPASP